MAVFCVWFAESCSGVCTTHADADDSSSRFPL